MAKIKDVFNSMDNLMHPLYIKGSTIINHKLRYSFRLTCDEYVMLDYIKRHQNLSNERIKYYDLFKSTGIIPSQVPGLWKSLKEKGLVYKHETGIVTTTKKWDKYFDFSKNFDEFWALSPVGNKQEARDKFNQCMKIVDYDMLLLSYKEYLSWCERTGTFVKHASTWLNPKKKHWEDKLHESKSNKSEIKNLTADNDFEF